MIQEIGVAREYAEHDEMVVCIETNFNDLEYQNYKHKSEYIETK
jgi:hypothetical protein